VTGLARTASRHVGGLRVCGLGSVDLRLHLLDGAVRLVFEAEEGLGVETLGGDQQGVDLRLQGTTLTVVGRLDDEHHDERDDGGHGGDEAG